MLPKKFLSNIKKRLLAEKEERLQRSAQKLDIDTDGDEVDKVQGNIQIDLHHQIANLNKLKIVVIDEALGRLFKKTYGVCIDCEEQIPEKRLLANPYYLTCISCAEERELEEKRGKGL
jgi:DnaK suppressor protein